MGPCVLPCAGEAIIYVVEHNARSTALLIQFFFTLRSSSFLRGLSYYSSLFAILQNDRPKRVKPDPPGPLLKRTPSGPASQISTFYQEERPYLEDTNHHGHRMMGASHARVHPY